MVVKELIEILQKFDQELSVAVADWNEEYAKPFLLWPGSVVLGETSYWNEKSFISTPCVIIGASQD